LARRLLAAGFTASVVDARSSHEEAADAQLVLGVQPLLLLPPPPPAPRPYLGGLNIAGAEDASLRTARLNAAAGAAMHFGGSGYHSVVVTAVNTRTGERVSNAIGTNDPDALSMEPRRLELFKRCLCKQQVCAMGELHCARSF
jgi:hypothetical protein